MKRISKLSEMNGENQWMLAGSGVGCGLWLKRSGRIIVAQGSDASRFDGCKILILGLCASCPVLTDACPLGPGARGALPYVCGACL